MTLLKKTLFAITAALTVFLFSCENFEEQLAQSQKEYQDLLAETEKKDSAMLSLVTAFNEVDENLQAIKEKENIINSNLGDDNVPKDYRQRVLDDIQSIYSLMEQNQAKVEELSEKLARTRSQLNRTNTKLDAATKQLAEYEKLIQSLRVQIEQKDAQIAELSERLVKMNFELDSMTTAYRAKSQLADEQELALNTAYYVFDTKKGLKENGIIEAKGGVAGIGAAKVLKQDFDKSYFTKVNIQETKSISLYAKKAKVLTNHPSTSFSIDGADGKADKLTIKDPIAFWESSKYLVIMIEQ